MCVHACHRIPPELVINMDQTGVGLVPVGKYTWARQGQKASHAHVHAHARPNGSFIGAHACGCKGAHARFWSSPPYCGVPKYLPFPMHATSPFPMLSPTGSTPAGPG